MNIVLIRKSNRGRLFYVIKIVVGVVFKRNLGELCFYANETSKFGVRMLFIMGAHHVGTEMI